MRLRARIVRVIRDVPHPERVRERGAQGRAAVRGVQVGVRLHEHPGLRPRRGGGEREVRLGAQRQDAALERVARRASRRGGHARERRHLGDLRPREPNRVAPERAGENRHLERERVVDCVFTTFPPRFPPRRQRSFPARLGLARARRLSGEVSPRSDRARRPPRRDRAEGVRLRLVRAHDQARVEFAHAPEVRVPRIDPGRRVFVGPPEPEERVVVPEVSVKRVAPDEPVPRPEVVHEKVRVAGRQAQHPRRSRRLPRERGNQHLRAPPVDHARAVAFELGVAPRAQAPRALHGRAVAVEKRLKRRPKRRPGEASAAPRGPAASFRRRRSHRSRHGDDRAVDAVEAEARRGGVRVRVIGGCDHRAAEVSELVFAPRVGARGGFDDEDDAGGGVARAARGPRVGVGGGGRRGGADLGDVDDVDGEDGIALDPRGDALGDHAGGVGASFREALVAPARVHEQEIRRMASPRRPAAFLRRLRDRGEDGLERRARARGEPTGGPAGVRVPASRREPPQSRGRAEGEGERGERRERDRERDRQEDQPEGQGGDEADPEARRERGAIARGRRDDRDPSADALQRAARRGAALRRPHRAASCAWEASGRVRGTTRCEPSRARC